MKTYVNLSDCPFKIGQRVKDDHQKGSERLGRIIDLNDECCLVLFDDGTECWRTWAHEQNWSGGGGLTKVDDDDPPTADAATLATVEGWLSTGLVPPGTAATLTEGERL